MTAVRPHILHVIDGLAPGGSERMAIEICNATDPQRYRTGICVTRQDLTLAPTLYPQVGLFHLDRQRTYDWQKFRQFNRFCQQEKVSLLHVHGWFSFRLVTFLAGLFTPVRRIPVLLHDHYGDVEISPSFPWTVRKAFKLRQPYYVGVCEKLTDLAVQAGIPTSRARTIRNALDFGPYQAQVEHQLSEWKLNRKGPFGIVVANLRASKDILLLLRGLAAVKDLDWTVAVVGDLVDAPYVKSCQALHQELGLLDRVLFLGKRLDVRQLLQQADLAILTSRTESGPLALIEYAAAGLPFVSTRVGSIGRQLEQTGLPGFFDPGDVLGLNQALQELLTLSPQERLARGALGRQIAAREFDIKSAMPAWYQVYSTILQQTG